MGMSSDNSDGDLKVFEDLDDSGDWRVEYFDDDGGCYVTIFSGPLAAHRARGYFDALKVGTLKMLRDPLLS